MARITNQLKSELQDAFLKSAKTHMDTGAFPEEIRQWVARAVVDFAVTIAKSKTDEGLRAAFKPACEFGQYAVGQLVMAQARAEFEQTFGR